MPFCASVSTWPRRAGRREPLRAARRHRVLKAEHRRVLILMLEVQSERVHPGRTRWKRSRSPTTRLMAPIFFSHSGISLLPLPGPLMVSELSRSASACLIGCALTRSAHFLWGHSGTLASPGVPTPASALGEGGIRSGGAALVRGWSASRACTRARSVPSSLSGTSSALPARFDVVRPNAPSSTHFRVSRTSRSRSSRGGASTSG